MRVVRKKVVSQRRCGKGWLCGDWDSRGVLPCDKLVKAATGETTLPNAQTTIPMVITRSVTLMSNVKGFPPRLGLSRKVPSTSLGHQQEVREAPSLYLALVASRKLTVSDYRNNCYRLPPRGFVPNALTERLGFKNDPFSMCITGKRQQVWVISEVGSRKWRTNNSRRIRKSIGNTSTS